MMEQKTSLDLRDSTSPPSIKFDSSPQQQYQNNSSPTNTLIKNGVLAFATLSAQTPITEPPKMQIKQLYVQPHQTEYPQLQTDKESDVYGYLQNLQSICYPNGVKIQSLQIKTQPVPLQTSKTSSQSPVKKAQQGQIDIEALEILKQFTIAHFTITTSLGVKRYISYLLCNEPQLLSNSPISVPQHSTLSQPQQHYYEYNIMPFTFVIVQDSPALDFAKKILCGLHETSLLPYYQMVCLIDQSQLKQQQAMGLFVQPLKIEFILSYMFRIINKPIEETFVKNFSEFRDSGSVLTFEDHLPIFNYENFYRPNISYKVLFKKISITNILQLINCLLLEKKLILISRNTDTNALIIEALLDLLYPLNSTIFMNISNLKQEIIDYLDSPVPYIIGINETIWNKIFMKKWNEVSDDTVCFFIETELFTTKVDLPNPPEPMNTIFSQTLQDIISRTTSLSDRDLKLYIRQAAFNYILLTINDFRHYRVNFKELEGEKQELFGMQKDNNIIGLRQIFKFEQYLESQQIENYEFYLQFTGTQIFNDFLERALRTNIDQQLNYFISCLDVLKTSQSFSELLMYQQQLLVQIQQEVMTKQANYVFSDILESYERSLNQFDKSIYIKALPLPSQIDNGLFQFNPNHIEVNLHYEILKQGCIRNLIKRPSASRKIKPSKKSDMNLGKHHTNFTTNQVESRNQSNSIKENQQIISQVYFQKGPQKVSTPKGLPSEMKSMGNFLSEDDSKSTNSKDHKNSQEENKSENSSFKSFFRFTFEKIQNKLKTNKAESSQPVSQAGTPQKQLQLLFDIKKINVQTLSGISSLSQEKKREGPLINQPYYMKNSMQQKSIFSTAFGPKSGLSFGRPKCYSETTTSKIQGALQTQIPSNVHYYVDSQNLEARPSAISISNKSYHDSPSSTSFMHESFATAAKGRNEVQNHGSHNTNNHQNNINSIRNDAMFKTQAQRDTPNSQGKTQGNSGSKVQQQLAYPILNSGIVILKDINRNTKKFVQKININLDPEDERNRRFNQRIQSSMQTSNNQITQSLSNSSLPGSSMQTSRTLNSSRSGGTGGGIMNSINKTQLSSGLDSPTDHSIHQGIKTSDKKVKNPSFKQASNGIAKQNSGGRQKAISYNQPTQNQEQNLRKPQVSSNIQITPQQSFKQYQTKPKAQLKVKRDSDLTSKQQTNQNISSLVSMKKSQTEKNTPLTYGRQEGRSSLNTNNHSSQLINSEYMIQGNSSNQASFQNNTQVKRSMMNSIQKDKNDHQQHQQQQHISQEETFDGVQQRMRSISYQINQPEFQSQIKYKMKKDKSLKNLVNTNNNQNNNNNQSPNFNQQDANSVKIKTSKTGNQTTKINDQTNLLQLPKNQQFQTFNEYTTTYDQHAKQQINLLESFDPSQAILDTDMLDTPKMKFEGTKISGNLESTISLSLEQSPSPNTNVVGQINQTIVRQDEQFGIYERNMKYNNEFQ